MKGNCYQNFFTSNNVLSQEIFQAKPFENVIAYGSYYHFIVSFNFSIGSNYIGLRSICLSLKHVCCVNLMKDTRKQELL